jgi:hypothetical protein
LLPCCLLGAAIVELANGNLQPWFCFEKQLRWVFRRSFVYYLSCNLAMMIVQVKVAWFWVNLSAREIG